MDSISGAYAAISDINLWTKVITNSFLSLADVPRLIGIRYPYLIENWSRLKELVNSRTDGYIDPDRAKKEFSSFNALVEIEATKSSGLKENDSRLLNSYYTVMDLLYVNDIPLTKQESAIIEQEKKRVLAFTKTDFINMRTALVAGRDAVADNMSATDADYNRVYKRSPLRALLDKNIGSIALSATFSDAVANIDYILVNAGGLSSQASIDPFAFARANANNPNIDIRSYSSGNLVRLEYGETLPKLATRIYGDETRWTEIAIANGLKPPYVDEVGETISLIANGTGNQINLAKVGVNGTPNRDKLYIGQVLFIQSDIEKNPDQRTVISLREIPVSGEIIVELSGEANLDIYKINDNAHIRVYAPSTINSNFYILVPSVLGTPDTVSQDVPWFLRSRGEDEKQAGVDLMLSDVGDLVFGASGDLSLSYAVDNAIQAIKLKLETEASSLPSHAEFGVNSAIGDVKSPQARQAITDSIVQQIGADPRFSRLDYLTVQSISSSTATGYLIKLGVVLNGGTTVIPISFRLNAT